MDGRYSIPEVLAGTYEVSIAGPGHVEHRSLRMAIPTNGNVPLSVIEWGSGRSGATYDEQFAVFFNAFARGTQHNRNSVRKWTRPPREIYVVKDGLTDHAFRSFNALLRRIVDRNMSRYLCEPVDVPITTGPFVEAKEGAVVIRFDGSFAVADYPILNPALIGHEIVGSRIRLVASLYSEGSTFPEINRENEVAHELAHAVTGALHAYGLGFGGGLMNGSNIVIEPSPEEALAACLMRHPDTKPGNMAPDTNGQVLFLLET